MWDVKACRCCLSTGGKLEKISGVCKRMYASVSGLEITPGDGFPYYFCVDCNLQMKKTLAFRRKCVRAYFAMKEILSIKKQITFSDIRTVDRKRTNLAYPYELCKEQNIRCYSITTHDATETVNDAGKSDYDLEISHIPGNKDIKYNIDIKPIAARNETNPDTNKSDTVTMVRYTPEANNSTFIVTDIKSAEYEEFVRLEEEKILEETYEEIAYDEPLADEIELENIDLDDVFKDLKEDVVEASSGDEEWRTNVDDIEEPVKKVAIQRKRRYKGWVLKGYGVGLQIYIDGVQSTVHGREIARAMRDVTVRLLPVAEQKAAFERAADTEPFKSARFKCGMCHSTHADMRALLTHIHVHNKNMRGCRSLCPVCSDRFPSPEALAVHGADRHWYEYTAKDTGHKMYGLASLIQWHRQRKNLPKEPGVNNVLCHYTHVSLSQAQMRTTVPPGLSNSKRHKKILKSIEGADFYQCDICGEIHNKRISFIRHMRTRHMFALQCKECGELCFNRQKAAIHRRQHVIIKCEFCSDTMKGRQKYNAHLQLKHSVGAGKSHCPMCGYMLYTETEMIRHQYRRHKYYCINDPSMGPPECHCDKCDLQFVDQAAYQLHVLNAGHRDLAQGIDLACVRCRMIFDTMEAKVAHAETCREEYPKPCIYCPEIILDGKHSKSHYQKLHPGETCDSKNIRLCEMCGKSLNRSTWFKHIRNHRNHRAVQCQHCSARLPNPKMYVSHVLFHHTLRPYLCAACPAAYKFRSNCREHILKVHAPELPYSCEFCARRFAHLDYLEAHSVRAHDVSVRKEHMANYNYLSRKQKDKIYVYPLMKIDASLVKPEILEKVEIEMCDYMDTNNRPVDDYRDYLVVENLQEPMVDVKSVDLGPALSPEANEVGDQRTTKRKKRMSDKMSEKVVKKKKMKNHDKAVIKDDRNILIGQATVKKENDRSRESSIMKEEKFETMSIEDRLAEFEGEGTDEDEERFATRERGVCGRSLPSLDEDVTVPKTEDVIEESESVVEQSESVVEQSEYVVEQSDSVVEQSEYVVVQSDSVVEETIDEQYEVIEQDGEQFVIIDGVLYKLETE